MSHKRIAESRRGTRVPLKVVIAARGLSESPVSDGETIVVNRHGALIFSSAALPAGLQIEIHVIISDKRAAAKVVYVDPGRAQVCGVELVKPDNIWGIPLPPDDWFETNED